MKTLGLLGALLFAALPATTNYRLNSYGFGSGGTSNSQTTTYSLEGTVGQISGQNSSTSNKTSNPGYIQTQQANVPKLTALDNNGGQYYNKLHFVIDSQNNPTDATYLVAVSSDNFVADTKYVQADGTLSSTLSTSQYRTYSGFGSSSGSLIIGLNPSTTYTVKLKATQGKFTESAYGPTSTQATVAPSITFDLVTSTQSSPPFISSLGTLSAGAIATSANTINSSFSTNGASGGDVYMTGKNGGLRSGSTGYKISALTNDLTLVSEGFGAQSSSVSQSSGGPLSVLSPYNATGSNVGIVDAITRSLYTSSSPVTSGNGVLVLKAKAGTNDIAASDYQEILTFTAAGNF